MRNSALIFFLDYIACYGGYVIAEKLEDGGKSHIYGSQRRSAREMYLSMYMLAQQLENMTYYKKVK